MAWHVTREASATARNAPARAWWRGGFRYGALLLLLVLGLLLSVGSAALPTASARQGHASSVPVPSIDKLREQAIKQSGPAIVEVVNVGKGLGSGVTLTKDGYIVTNDHVVSGAHQIAVALHNGQTVRATLKGTDPVDDLAVIKIDVGTNLPTATLGDSSQLQVGQTVLAIGNPLGIVHTVTDGIVSALGRVVAEGQHSNGRILNAIQTSAPINPGNSGGALINLAGQVVGIPTLTAINPEFNAPAGGVGFAIPSNRVKDISAQIMKNGKVTHSGIADLGIQAAQVTPKLAQQYNLPVQAGVLIAGFTANSPAKKAGLPKGAIIVQVGQTPIETNDALLTVLSGKKPGDTVTVTALVPPHGAKHTYKVTLGELNVNTSSTSTG